MSNDCEYQLEIHLTKHKDAHPFIYHYKGKSDEDIQGIKEKICMDMEKTFGTPCKCTKVRKIND